MAEMAVSEDGWKSSIGFFTADEVVIAANEKSELMIVFIDKSEKAAEMALKLCTFEKQRKIRDVPLNKRFPVLKLFTDWVNFVPNQWTSVEEDNESIVELNGSDMLLEEMAMVLKEGEKIMFPKIGWKMESDSTDGQRFLNFLQASELD